MSRAQPAVLSHNDLRNVTIKIYRGRVLLCVRLSSDPPDSVSSFQFSSAATSTCGCAGAGESGAGRSIIFGVGGGYAVALCEDVAAFAGTGGAMTLGGAIGQCATDAAATVGAFF